MAAARRADLVVGVILRGSLKTVHITAPLQGGVVRLPSYLRKIISHWKRSITALISVLNKFDALCKVMKIIFIIMNSNSDAVSINRHIGSTVAVRNKVGWKRLTKIWVIVWMRASDWLILRNFHLSWRILLSFFI